MAALVALPVLLAAGVPLRTLLAGAALLAGALGGVYAVLRAGLLRLDGLRAAEADPAGPAERAEGAGPADPPRLPRPRQGHRAARAPDGADAGGPVG